MKPEPVAYALVDENGITRSFFATRAASEGWQRAWPESYGGCWHKPLYDQAALDAVRADALEEAAKVCDDARVAWAQKHGNPVTNPFDAGHTSAYLLAADAIRAMKGKENSDE